MLPRAPQFFTLPETEDRTTVDRVKAAATEIGAKLKSMAPDFWLIFSNEEQRRLVFLVTEPEIERAADQQHRLTNPTISRTYLRNSLPREPAATA
jgi:sarcosine oxidase gamma subunit